MVSPRYGQVILVSGYPCFDSCQLITTWMCKIRLHLPSHRNCEIKHWCPCGVDGWSFGRSVYGHVIAKFFGLSRFT